MCQKPCSALLYILHNPKYLYYYLDFVDWENGSVFKYCVEKKKNLGNELKN